jgi:hypothetical protein
VKKITVTVKGKPGNGAGSAAYLIERAMLAQGASVVTNDEELAEDLKAIHSDAAGVRFMSGTTITLKRKQLPRVQKGTLKVEVSQEEWTAVQIIRGRRMTGLVDHRTQDGLYYFWCWGSQPDGADRVTGKTPLEAAEAHMKVYERWEGGMARHSINPVRKARTA